MKTSNSKEGQFFTDDLMQSVKDAFHYVDIDLNGRRRLFFDNAGGSFRLKKCIEAYANLAATPDCPERIHETAIYLQSVQDKGQEKFKMMLNVEGGSVYTALTASKAMFDMVRVITDHISGSNMVTTVLEHPSAYDAMELNSERTGYELRVARSNTITGGVDVEEITKLIDQDTVLLTVIYASNISGAKLDIEAIVSEARKIKPDLYILVDAVQHAPHDVIDLTNIPVDGISIAPYKFFGNRGMGLAWVSDRAAALRHDKLSGKPSKYWDLGSSDPAQYAMFSEIINYVSELGKRETNEPEQRAQFEKGMQMIALHERALLARLLNGTEEIKGLREMQGVDVYLDYEDLTKRDLILAINFKNIEPAAAVKEYSQHGVTVFERVNTSLYSKRMLESFGLQGAIRVSPLHCHSAKDMDEFLAITKSMSEAKHKV
ncbi:MAG: cysteine desulfurase/selenocysteine lyase [Cocleimonas sp.]|jgi:cysteine desulfurase/selenocysteine lyase